MTNDAPPFADLLESLRPAAAFLVGEAGDHGDRLVSLGLRNQLVANGVATTGRPRAAGVFVAGGGDGSCRPAVLEQVRRLSARFPATPLVIPPSSFERAPHELAAAVADRSGPSWIYAREPESLAAARSCGFAEGVVLGIDDDLSLRLGRSRFLQRLRARAAARHILVVERMDQPEAVASPPPDQERARERAAAWMRAASREIMPDPLRRAAHRWSALRELAPQAQTPFAVTTVAHLMNEHAELRSLPVFADDIVLPERHSFGEFCALVAGSAAIVTNRAHVAALGGMLEKPAYLVPGRWPRLRSFYAQSLAAEGRVRLLDL